MNKILEEPKYHNKEILIYCMNREPHSLIFDHNFINYRDFEVIQLCEDLEMNFEYLSKLCKKDNKDILHLVEIAQSLVWAGLFHHHNDIVPLKYKQNE